MNEGVSSLESLKDFVETFNVICPACKGAVEVEPDASAIKCLKCSRVYPVTDGIPSLVVEDAAIEDEEPHHPA